AVGQLERLNAPQQLGFARTGLQVLGVETGEQVELPALVFARHVLGAVKVEDGVPLGAKESPLIGRGKKTGVPVERSPLDPLIVSEHDVAGEVLVVAPQAVG